MHSCQHIQSRGIYIEKHLQLFNIQVKFLFELSKYSKSSLIPSQSIIVNTKSVILSSTLSPSSTSSSPKGMSCPPVYCSFSTVPTPSIPTISLSGSLSLMKHDVPEAARHVPIPCSPVKDAEFLTMLRHCLCN